jgi:hypothetical protein
MHYDRVKGGEVISYLVKREGTVHNPSPKTLSACHKWFRERGEGDREGSVASIRKNIILNS